MLMVPLSLSDVLVTTLACSYSAPYNFLSQKILIC